MAINKLKQRRNDDKKKSIGFDSGASMSIIVPNSRNRGKTITPTPY